MKFTVVIEKGEKYYIAYVPSMSGCHTQAPTIKKLMEYIKEAAVLHLSLYKNNKKSDFVGFRLLEV
ncbi:MAG: type II toxin-antitoxin system HicB family antitoxin [Candidatus Aenigmarchaeota archaeon]|nr:type II toxin-antitoxin system HicB family antitoxin [Candidatus Aenigmarchaeota archaeon]